MRALIRCALARRIAAIATAAVFALLLALPPAASARKLQMSGTWAIRAGQIFLPLQFAQTRMGTQMTGTSMGNLSQGLGTPNGPIAGAGPVTATGSGPATLRVPPHRFQTSPEAVYLPSNTFLLQITTMLVVDAPVETATLQPGGGPGSFEWCPNDTLGCPVTGPPNGGSRNGRVIYRAGANRFGGAMQLGLAGGGVVSFAFNASPLQVGHAHNIAYGPTHRARAVGRGTPANPSIRTVYLPPFVVTQPTMFAPPIGLYAGPMLTTMFGLSTTGTGPILRLGTIGTSVGGMPFAISTTEIGFAHTTGTVIVQQTVGTGGEEYFTVMGSDMRTALGAGNISTVAGGISFQTSNGGQTPYAVWHKVWFSLAPPVPSLSPAGMAAAGALLLLAVGYALRGRR